MLISVNHVTRYAYEAEARYSVQTVRLTPQSFAGQRVLEWSIDAPGIETASKFVDCFGNVAHQITIMKPHDEIAIAVTGKVETEDRAGVVSGTIEVAPTRVYLRTTEQTAPDDAIRQLAKDAATADTAQIAQLHALMEAIADRVDYEPGNTHAHTSAADALAEGKGVCQDHAHIMIAAARLLDLPARYVNGYLVGEAAGGHAWAEVFVPGLGWVGFDPANRVCPTDTYVRVAVGLDAASAPPIRGTRRGGGKETLDVSVSAESPGQSQSQSQSQSQ
ncbi:MAG: transglutaminase family protein [Hyphomicrobiaceae bacterium]|nr:transglutaminase family protein [Hyphomicrobiaceae bacterium]